MCLRFAVEEVTTSQSQYLSGMNDWLEHVFPEYCPARFDRLLAGLRHADGRHQIQIFIERVEDQVVGLVQLFYRLWQGGLLADIDLLGVLAPYRRTGVAQALVQRSLEATREMARCYQVLAIGVVTLIEPNYAPIVCLHRKLGGQIRRDYPYPSGDIVAWHPLQPEYADVATPILGAQLRLFGELLKT